MSFKLTICTLIIGILMNSINGVPQYSREYLSPVIGLSGGSNWYTQKRATGSISETPNKDSFTFIDSSEVRSVQPLPTVVRRTYQQQHVSFRTDDDSTENNRRTMGDEGVMTSPLMNSNRSRTLHTRSGGDAKSGIGVQRDRNGVLKIVYPTRHPNQNYDVLTPGNHVRLASDEDDDAMEHRESDIVFPNDTDTNFHNPPNTDNMIPKCKTDEILCTDVDNYPENFIESIVKEEADRYRFFFGEDKLTQPNVTSRLGAPEDSQLCDSSEKLIFPQWGLTSDDKWKLIVNTPNYTQGIRVEQCIRQKSRCNFANHFPNGYEPVCEQKFITRQLVSITGRTMATEPFKIPSCCNCVLKLKKLKNFDSPTSEEN